MPAPVCFVRELFTLETDPGDAHLLHVGFAQIAGTFGFEADHLRDLLAGKFPLDARKLSPRVIGAFRILHHLPEAFETCVTFSAKDKWRRSKVGKDSQLVTLGENYFAGVYFLRQDFPVRFFRIVYRRPPMCGITRVAGGLLRDDGSTEDQK